MDQFQSGGWISFRAAASEHLWEAGKSAFGAIPIAGDVAQVGELATTTYDAVEKKRPMTSREQGRCKVESTNAKRALEDLKEEKARFGL